MNTQIKHYDLIVIGGGSGGVRSARFAGQKGLHVLIIEAKAWGGTCVNVGCVPKKLYAHSAGLSAIPEKAAHFGWSFQSGDCDLTQLKSNSDRYIARLNKIYETLLERQNVDMVHGHAFFVDAHTVGVGEERYHGDKILVATGGQPFVPEIPGAEFSSVSDDFFRWNTVPASVTVVGGGYIGVELASILSRLGAHVSLVHRGALLLRGFDEDIRQEFTRRIAESDIDLRFDV